jgi:hypothetical protein
MAVIEVSRRCNLACPMCYADAEDELGPSIDISISEIERRAAMLLKKSDAPIPLQISGGEPTLREDLPQVLRALGTMGFTKLEIVTNGVRIAAEPGYLKTLAEAGATSIYLQFDSLTAKTSRRLRGSDLIKTRKKAVAEAREAGLCATLACAVVKGVNEAELPGVIQFAWDNIDTVRAINFQAAVPFAGRFPGDSDAGSYSLPEVTSLAAEAAGVAASGFLSCPIGHSRCNAAALVFQSKDGPKSLFEHIGEDEVLRFLGKKKREKVLGLFQGKERVLKSGLTDPAMWRLLFKSAGMFGGNPFGMAAHDHLLLFTKSFMGQDELDGDRLYQCVYAIAAEDGVRSFCLHNNRHRFQGASPPLQKEG